MNKQNLAASAAPTAERVYRGVNNEQRVAERRQRLLLAAITCFGTHGFHKTTLKMLCGEAGLTERYFYESFVNFEDILCCAHQLAVTGIYENVKAAVAKAPPNAHERMLAGLDGYFAAIGADKARARLILIEIEGLSKILSERVNDAYLMQLEVANNLLQHHICAGVPTNPDNGLTPHLLFSGMLGAIYQIAKDWAGSNFNLPRSVMVSNAHAVSMAIVGVLQAGPTVDVCATKTTKKRN